MRKLYNVDFPMPSSIQFDNYTTHIILAKENSSLDTDSQSDLDISNSDDKSDYKASPTIIAEQDPAKKVDEDKNSLYYNFSQRPYTFIQSLIKNQLNSPGPVNNSSNNSNSSSKPVFNLRKTSSSSSSSSSNSSNYNNSSISDKRNNNINNFKYLKTARTDNTNNHNNNNNNNLNTKNQNGYNNFIESCHTQRYLIVLDVDFFFFYCMSFK